MSEQEMREKVIYGLECCAVGAECDHCPYSRLNDGGYQGCYQMHQDALALLKVQEPIIPIRRSAHVQGADDVWYECGKCGEFLGVNRYSKQFCANCGKPVKWE